MGLDMCLKGNRWLRDNSYLTEQSKEELKENEKIQKIKNFFPEINKKTNSIEVSFEIGYWRKANAIHNWFIQNCANGVDDCRPVYVIRSEIETLLSLCEEVVKVAKIEKGKVWKGTSYKDGKKEEIYEDGEIITNPEEIAAILPTNINGCFFGCEHYDEYYLSQIKDTIDILKYALSLPKNYDFYYEASW